MKQIVVYATVILWWGGLPSTVSADEPLELGVRVNALYADGDLQGVGMHLRKPFPDGYFAAATLDRYLYDHGALPATLVREELLAPRRTSTVAGISIGRSRSLGESRLAWFWSIGIAAGFPHAIAARPQAGHAILRTGTEVHLRSAVGLEKLLTEHWSLRAALRMERHYVDLRYEDPATGRRASTSMLTAAGFYLSLGYRF